MSNNSISIRVIGSNQTEMSIGDVVVLLSYNTPVAALVPGMGWLKTSEHFSSTTSKHINAWIPKGGKLTIKPQEFFDGLMVAGR